MNIRSMGAWSLVVTACFAVMAGAEASPIPPFVGYDAGVTSVPVGGNAATARSDFKNALVDKQGQSEGFNLPGDGAPIPPGPTPDPYQPAGGYNLWGLAGANLSPVGGYGASNSPTHYTATLGQGLGRFDTTGNQSNGDPSWYWETDHDFTVTFGSLFNAFGFYATDAGDFGGTFSITLLDAQGHDADTLCVTSTTSTASSGCALQVTGNENNGGLLFFGFADAAVQGYSGVRFNVSQASCPLGGCNVDVIGFDDFIIGNVSQSGGGSVPEPGTLALVAVAGMLGLRGRRAR